MPRDSKLDTAFCGSTANLKESNIHYHETMTYSLMTAKNQASNHLQKHFQFCRCLTNTNNTNN